MNESLKFVYTHFLLTEDNVKEIISEHSETHVPKGAYLLEEGQIVNEYFILEKGLVRAFVIDTDGNEITMEFFADNEIVIISMSLFQKNPSQENLQAITECALWKINFDDFQRLFRKLEGLREWGRAWFSYQLFTMKQRSLDMITQSASERYLKLIKEKPAIIHHAPLKQIASYLGITDSSLSRIRKEITLR